MKISNSVSSQSVSMQAFFFTFRIVDSKPHSRMWYRIGAVRNMTGGRKTQPATKMNEKLKEVWWEQYLDI